MWFPKVLSLITLWVVMGNLAGIGWGWYRRDLLAGWSVAVIGGSLAGMMMMAVTFAVWILLGSPTS
jgi:hypothetical protein